jgi:hypothetical protein
MMIIVMMIMHHTDDEIGPVEGTVIWGVPLSPMPRMDGACPSRLPVIYTPGFFVTAFPA